MTETMTSPSLEEVVQVLGHTRSHNTNNNSSHDHTITSKSETDSTDESIVNINTQVGLHTTPVTPSPPNAHDDLVGVVVGVGVGLQVPEQPLSTSSSSIAPTPPPQAFQSLPLSSGTIRPPSFTFTTPNSCNSNHNDNNNESTIYDLIEEEENHHQVITTQHDDNNNDTNLTTSSSNSNNSSNSSNKVGKLKGINDFLNAKEEEEQLPQTTTVVLPVVRLGLQYVVNECCEENDKNIDNDNIMKNDNNEHDKTTPRVGNNHHHNVSEISSSLPSSSLPSSSKSKDINHQTNNNIDTDSVTVIDTDITPSIPISNPIIPQSLSSPSPSPPPPPPPNSSTNNSVSSSSLSNSNNNYRSLLPRSLDDSTTSSINTPPPPTSKQLVHLNLSLRNVHNINGSRSSSILSSSQEEDSNSSRIGGTSGSSISSKDYNTIKDLGLLLDRHHHQITTRRRNSYKEIDWWQNDNHTSDRSGSSSGGGGGGGGDNSFDNSKDLIRSTSRDESCDRELTTTMTTPRPSSTTRRSSIGASSVASSIYNSGGEGANSTSTSGTKTRRFGRLSNMDQVKKSDSLFDNFDKTWQSFHSVMSSSSSSVSDGNVVTMDTFRIEQYCFASMVLVLLPNIPIYPRSDSSTSLSSSSSSTSKTKSVPLDIVKFFWKEVILTQRENNSFKIPNDLNIDTFIENTITCISNKLRYISIESNDGELGQTQETERGTGIGTTPKQQLNVKLNHDVYADYSTHILKRHTEIHPDNQIMEWSTKFVSALEKIVLLDDDSDDVQESTKYVVNYAATCLPKLILNSIHSTLPNTSTGITSNNNSTTATTIDSLQDQEKIQKERITFFISLMKNPKFLTKRMKILGVVDKAQLMKLKKNINQDKNKVMLSTMSYLENIKLDVLRATKAHLEDLEQIHLVISLLTKEIYVKMEDGDLNMTEAVILLYKAWKELCLSSIQVSDGPAPKDMSEDEVQNKSSNDSSTPVSIRNRMYMKENRLEPTIKASESVQATVLTHFRLASVEYKLEVNGCVATLDKTQATSLSDDTSKKSSPYKRSSKRGKVTMKLPDVLKIDSVLLYHYLAVGKSIYLLGKSIFDASLNSIDHSPTGTMPKVLSGAAPNAAAIKFTIIAIEIFMKLANIMSFILSEDLTDVDEDDLIDVGFYYDKTSENVDPSSRMRKLLQDRTEARNLFGKLNIIRVESWHAMGNYISLGISEGYENTIEMSAVALLNHLNEKSVSDIDPSTSDENKVLKLDSNGDSSYESYKSSLQFKVLLCFQVALGILLQNNSVGKNFDRSFENELNNILVHERNLQAIVIHSIGVHYYEQVGDYERAKMCLNSSITGRRMLLRLLQREEPDDGSLSGSSIGSRRSMQRNYKRSYQRVTRRGSSTRQKTSSKSKEEQVPLIDETSSIDNIIDAEPNRKKQVAIIEKGLSTTLEFAALVSHCLYDYQTSLSLFQEALILRALHSGKDSLEVASLQYNMGVIHDDLAEYESSLSRYGESLRVRYNLLEKMKTEFGNGSSLNSMTIKLGDLEASVILILRCMGNVYRALGDASNSIGCLIKAVELLKVKLKRRTSESSFGLYQSAEGDLGFGKGMRLFPTLPMPSIILDEMKIDTNNSVMHLKILDNCLDKLQTDDDDDDMDEDDAVRKDIANMYTNIISLVKERNTQGNKTKFTGRSGNTSSASNNSVSSPVHVSNPKSNKIKKSLDATSDNDSIILDSAFNLGLLALHFKNHKNALHYFEEALRTLWTSFSEDSSGESSDSDFSSSRSSKTRQQKTYFEGQVEEGVLYHALAVAHASLSDHERAIRCYVTALRYYRRHLGLENVTVAGALYDCAYSYWKLCDFGRAEDFWADCIKILLSINEGRSSSSFYDLHVARTLYFLAATKISKGEYNDQYISTCLSDASTIFRQLSRHHSTLNFNIAIGHCYFYSGFLHYKKSLSMVAASNTNSLDTTDESTSEIRFEDLKSKEDHLHLALSFANDSLESYLVESVRDVGLDQVGIGQKLQHPMQGHIALLSAWIRDELGSFTQAQWNYKIAVRLLNKIYSPDNIFSASAMHSLGNLLVRLGNGKEALKCYEESLMCRAKLLGSDHSAVADTLFKMAGIIGNDSDHSKATSMYTHCLKIRMLAEGNDGENVSTTLLSLGLLHDKFGYHRKAREYLEGALKIRKNRLHTIIHKCIANVEQGIDENTDRAELKIQDTVRDEQVELAIVYHHLGNTLLKIGDNTEALSAFKEALLLRRKLCDIGPGGFAELVGRTDLDIAIDKYRDIFRDMADTLHNIGGVYEIQNMQQQALGCYNQSLIIKRSISRDKKVEFSLDDKIKSCNTLSSAITLLRIGAIHNELHNFDVGFSYFKSALSIQREHLGNDHIAVANTLAEMGAILRKRIENPIELVDEDKASMEASASKCFNEALRIRKLCYGPDHLSVAGVLYDIGNIHDQRGEYATAFDCYQHSVRVYGREYGKTLCKSLFNISSMQRRNNIVEVVDNDLGLFHPTSFRNNVLNRSTISLSRCTTISTSNTADIDREAYLKASFALAQVAARSGIVWLNGSTFQSFVFRILHLISANGVDPVKETLNKVIRQFAKASTHAIVTVRDVPQSNYLYLIQE